MKTTAKILTGLILSICLSNCNTGTNEEPKSEVNVYAEYLKESSESIAKLDPERKSVRAKILLALNSNPVYKDLINNKLISEEYLLLLTVISQGVCTISESGYYLTDELVSKLKQEKDGEKKLEVAVKIVGLAMPSNGGIPTDIIDILDVYKRKFGFYGFEGDTKVTGSGKQINIPTDYDISGIFGLISSKDPEALDAVYEARDKGLSTWVNIENATFQYLSSKSGYMAHLRRVYPSSNHLITIEEETSANELSNQYENNEVAADAKFKNKQVLISGIITTFGKDLSDDPYISFQTGDFQAVTCYFSQDQIRSISKLNKGDEVKIVGNCQGLVMGNIVVMESQFWE